MTAIRVAVLSMTITLGLLVAGCSRAHEGPSRASDGRKLSASYVHAVFFTLKPNVTEAQIEELVADGNGMLASIPAVKRVECGRRDTAMDRPHNDTRYHVGMVMYFDDRDGLQQYLTHPTHDQYVEKHKDLWESVRVYDYVAR